MSERTYVMVGDHAENLQSGRMVGPGDRIPESELQDGDRWLVDEDRLLEDSGPEELSGDALKSRARDLNIPGRGSMNADELREAIAKAEEESA